MLDGTAAATVRRARTRRTSPGRRSRRDPLITSPRSPARATPQRVRREHPPRRGFRPAEKPPPASAERAAGGTGGGPRPRSPPRPAAPAPPQEPPPWPRGARPPLPCLPTPRPRPRPAPAPGSAPSYPHRLIGVGVSAPPTPVSAAPPDWLPLRAPPGDTRSAGSLRGRAATALSPTAPQGAAGTAPCSALPSSAALPGASAG